MRVIEHREDRVTMVVTGCGPRTEIHVDPIDADTLGSRSWSSRGGIAMAHTPGSSGTEVLGRRILGLRDPKRLIKYLNGNGCDCRRENMQIVPASEIRRNTRQRKLTKKEKQAVYDSMGRRVIIVRPATETHPLSLCRHEDGTEMEYEYTQLRDANGRELQHKFYKRTPDA